ncbi:Uncharacterized protein dnm_044980 [Desulfonema magnum]|uniref:Uncharacterized protein n=1 Tax=Desulfonema magnum TaxID=45655 RepID=A0A975GP48_9BACT|nr:Uncharacterized protein dnm_044980 [Desulfonema magnum]
MKVSEVTKVNKVAEVKSSFMFRCERSAHGRLYESLSYSLKYQLIIFLTFMFRCDRQFMAVYKYEWVSGVGTQPKFYNSLC